MAGVGLGRLAGLAPPATFPAPGAFGPPVEFRALVEFGPSAGPPVAADRVAVARALAGRAGRPCSTRAQLSRLTIAFRSDVRIAAWPASRAPSQHRPASCRALAVASTTGASTFPATTASHESA